MPPVLANVHRLREIAVAGMVEGSAQARLNAALRSRSTVANKILNLKVGDSVDFFRPPSTKDASGWFGPATVVDVSSIARGEVSARYCRGLYEVQLRDLRRHSVYWFFLLADRTQHRSLNAWSDARRILESLPPRSLHLVGYRLYVGTWTRVFGGLAHDAAATLLSACRYFAITVLCSSQLAAVRAGRGVHTLPPLRG